MNPLKKFKKYIIGDALAQAEDVFEKGRIELTYNFTVFFLALGLLFYSNLIANHYIWQTYITTIGVILLFSILIVLKKTKNVYYAGLVFVWSQIIVGLLNEWMYKFELNTQGAFWIIVLIQFTFSVLGKRVGLIITAVTVVQLLARPISEVAGLSWFEYNIPPEQVIPSNPFFVMMPFLLNVYGLYEIVKTRSAAEGQISEQKKLLEESNKELESKNEDVTASINYAKRIQYAVLPVEETIYRSIPLSFILYKPRDIVSGDFFWFHEIDRDNYIIVCADCTGHGVPGALMTVIGSSLLNQVVVENRIIKPADILSQLDKKITHTLKQEKTRHDYVHDGMDLALLKVDKAKKEFIFTSAKRPAIFMRNKQIEEFKGSKNTLGGLLSGEKQFEEIKMKYEEDDIIYLFTDGYIDQFGGESNKKFMIKRFREVLQNIHMQPMHDQMQNLQSTISNWIGKNEQTDDITVIGIRF
jgi:serine phosphatase RsbU (regulator of sigma subunit)